MVKTIALFNQSGGAGKTTLTLNLGYALAQRGRRVLLLDFDPQATLSSFLGIEVGFDDTAFESVVDQKPLPIQRRFDMDIVPSNIRLAEIDIRLSAAIAREYKLKRALAAHKDSYDFILIDCPPSLGLVSLLALVASSHILVPMHQPKAFWGMEKIVSTVHDLRESGVAEPKFAGIIPNNHGRTKIEQAVVQQAIDSFGAFIPILPSIPRAIALVESGAAQKPLALYAPRHPVCLVLEQIAQHLESL